MDIISRKEAKNKGIKRFYTGKPCVNGHLSPRYIGSGNCIECHHLYLNTNKEKLSENHKEWQRKNKHHRVLRKLSKEEQAIVKNTPKPEVCPICKKSDVNFVLDHCHQTGKFRGWICLKCNLGIGNLGDSCENIQRALDYVKSFDTSY